jgi:hypothetical protein
VRRILSVLLEALRRPIGHGCWVDPTTRGRGHTLGSVQAECPPEYRDPAQLGTTVVGKDGVSAPRYSPTSRAGDHRMPISVIVEPSTRETFTPRELADAYEEVMKHGPRYLDAESGIEGSVYRFGMRVLILYEEPETGVMVFCSPNLVEGFFSEVELPLNGVLGG